MERGINGKIIKIITTIQGYMKKIRINFFLT